MLTRRELIGMLAVAALARRGSADPSRPLAGGGVRGGGAAGTAGAGPTAQRGAVDPGLPPFQPVKGVAGRVRCVGSSVVADLVTRWGEALRPLQPGLAVDVRAGGAGAAFPAMIAEGVELGLLNRAPNADELASYRKALGADPIVVAVALDALAIFVNRENPIEKITLKDLEAIWGAAPKRGRAAVQTWGELGVGGDLGSKTIRLFGHRDSSGGYQLFREAVLGGGDYRAGIGVEPGPAAIVNAVGSYPDATGFASEFFASRRVKPLPLSADGARYVAASRETALDGSYPLSRTLHVVLRREAGKPVDPAARLLVQFALSRQGQEIAARDGNYPLSAAMAATERAKLG